MSNLSAAEIADDLLAKAGIDPKAERANGSGRAKKGFDLVIIDDITLDAEPPWLIDDLIPSGPSLGVIFGRPKAKKSFFAADLFFHVAMARAYCGRAVRPGAVVYITNEGVKAFRRRMVAMRQHHGVEGKRVPFFVVRVMPNLGTRSGDAESLAQTIREKVPHDTPVAAVIIDTLSRAMPGGSDAETRDMSMFVANVGIIAEALQCHVAAVHHTPRTDENRTRGSGVLDGAADVLISITAEAGSDISTACVAAMKDGEADLFWTFGLVQVEVMAGTGVGEKRNKKACCAPVCATLSEPARRDGGARGRNKNLTASQRRFLDILAEAIVDHGELVPGSPRVPAYIKAVTRVTLRKCLLDAGFLDREKPHSARTIFARSLNDLAGRYLIGTDAEHVWLPK